MYVHAALYDYTLITNAASVFILIYPYLLNTGRKRNCFSSSATKKVALTRHTSERGCYTSYFGCMVEEAHSNLMQSDPSVLRTRWPPHDTAETYGFKQGEGRCIIQPCYSRVTPRCDLRPFLTELESVF